MLFSITTQDSIICMHYITVAVGKHGRHVMAEFLCVVLSKLKVKYSFIYTHGHVNSSTVPTWHNVSPTGGFHWRRSFKRWHKRIKVFFFFSCWWVVNLSCVTARHDKYLLPASVSQQCHQFQPHHSKKNSPRQSCWKVWVTPQIPAAFCSVRRTPVRQEKGLWVTQRCGKTHRQVNQFLSAAIMLWPFLLVNNVSERESCLISRFMHWWTAPTNHWVERSCLSVSE